MMQLRHALAGLCLLILLTTHTVLAASEETAPTLQNVPVNEKPIVAEHVLAPGERETLSPNFVGLQNIAMSHLPLSINFINVIEAWREIVNGVRYEIFLNGVDTKANDKEIVCHMIVLEKPWLHTQWGDKVRELRYSNCSRDANLADEAAKAQALNDKDQLNPIFNGGTRNELTVEEMKELESQIVLTSKIAKVEVNDNNAAAASKAEVSQEQPVEYTTTQPLYNEPITLAPSTEPAELSGNEKKWLDEFFAVGAVNFENSQKAAAAEGVTYEDGAGSSREQVYVLEQQQQQQPQEQQEQSPEQVN